jgi:hypothetical protein
MAEKAETGLYEIGPTAVKKKTFANKKKSKSAAQISHD